MGRDFRLLVIDPLEGFLGGTDANKNSNVRETMAGIVGLAGEERFSVIAIQHLNKSGNSAAYRVGGSIAFTALARSVWIFVKDRRNPDRRLFLPLKNNLGIDTGGFAYHTEPVEKSSRIVWDGEVDDDIDDVMSVFPIPPERTSPEQEGILELLRGKAPELMGTGDIAVTLGKRESAVTNLLNKLKKNGLVNNPSYGRWSVSPLSPVSSNSPVSSKGEGGETSAAREVSLPPFTGESSESDEFDETSTGNSLARDKAVQNF
jgi:DNA-binding transcriptional ArsR family regulator